MRVGGAARARARIFPRPNGGCRRRRRRLGRSLLCAAPAPDASPSPASLAGLFTNLQARSTLQIFGTGEILESPSLAFGRHPPSIGLEGNRGEIRLHHLRNQLMKADT